MKWNKNLFIAILLSAFFSTSSIANPLDKCVPFNNTFDEKSIHVYLIKSNHDGEKLLSHASGFPYERMRELKLKSSVKEKDTLSKKETNISLSSVLHIIGNKFNSFAINDSIYGIYGDISYTIKQNGTSLERNFSFSRDRKEFLKNYISLDVYKTSINTYKVIICTNN